MNDYDNLVLGVGNPDHPANQQDNDSEEDLTLEDKYDMAIIQLEGELYQDIVNYVEFLENKLKQL